MSLERQLRERLKGKVVIVGVGNPLRGDDAAGCRVVEQLPPAPRLEVLDAQETPESYFGAIARMEPDTVVFVDAVDLGGQPGAAALIEKDQISDYLPTTHRAPLSILMSLLARETDADVFLLAVQPGSTDFGAAMSNAVELSCASLAETIEQIALTASISQTEHTHRRDMESLL